MATIVNGNFNDTTPAAPSGKQNVKWQADASGSNPRNVSAYLDSFVGDSGSGGTGGAVPAPASGDAAAAKFLKADGTWAVPGGVGSRPFYITFYLPGILGSFYIAAPSRNLLRFIPAAATTFASGLGGSTATAATAATGSTVFSLQKNGVQFGTITFNASGTSGTFAAASSTSFDGSTDVFSIVGPVSADATLADIGFVVLGLV